MSSIPRGRFELALKSAHTPLAGMELAHAPAGVLDSGVQGYVRSESSEGRQVRSLLYRLEMMNAEESELRLAQSAACLHEIFERQVDRNSSVPALECGDRILTYGQVDAEANRMARYLRSLGVGCGSYVGISLDRSEWPIVTILAVLKSGAAYVPIDPSLPNDRLRYIADAADLVAIVTEETHESRFRELSSAQVVTLEAYRTAAAAHADTRLSRTETGVDPSAVCYVLFTSGTTGRPKGVVTEHRNVAHFVSAFNEVTDTTSEDRIFQGFSLGFDGSVEEMWMAFSNGATLVCGDASTPRFGADLAAYLQDRKITFLSTVPTLLSTLTQDVASLRQLVVSGEACPVDLVNRWSRPGLEMLNVYGPTETTVNTTAAVLKRGKPVCIGRPLRGYQVHVLDQELRPVSGGKKGELFIGGPGLSRGYLKQPELTARSFIDWTAPANETASQAETTSPIRLYRTGDLVRWNEEGELEFFGRIDSQVKLRGFRIELAEIETILIEQPEITAATVKIYEESGLQSLAAYILLSDGSARPDRSRLLAILRDRLPAYMVPTYLDVLESFPMLASGKVDRGRLPPPRCALIAEDAAPDADLSPLEASLASVWSKQLRLAHIGPEQDFFTDLGGHSLLAAQLVTALRNELGYTVPVRDIYAHRTVRSLAAHIDRTAPRVLPDEPGPSAAACSPAVPRRPWWTNALQFVYLLSVVPLLALPTVYVVPAGIELLQGRGKATEFVLIALGAAMATWLTLVLIAIVAKWTIIGRYRRGCYPLWRSYYVRWWIVSRLQHLSFISALNGTPLAPVIWRAFGAKVGRRCVLNASLVYAWDCIRIGDDTSIGVDTHMPGLRIEDGYLVIGSVEIGDRCFIGNHSMVGLDVRMGNDARLDDQSLLADRTVVPTGGSYRGSPAQEGVVPVPEGTVIEQSRLWFAAFGTMQLVAGAAVALVTLLPVTGAAALMTVIATRYPAGMALPAFIGLVPATMLVFTLWAAFCKRLVHPKPRPGIYEVYTFTYLQHWLSGVVMQIVQTIGLPMFTTVYLPPWMRLLGARLGRHTEMSTVWRINPDMLTAGDGVFFADGCMIGGSRTHLGRFEVARNEIGDRTFLGNTALLPAGAKVGSNCLLGVLSAPPKPNAPIPDNTDWLGSPGFLLPNRQKVSCFDPKLTFAPTMWLYLQRALIDGLRVLLPGYILGGIGILSLLVVVTAYVEYGAWGAYTAVPVLTWMAISLCLVAVVGLKWLVMGEFQPVVVPLWSRYVWWNELINGLYESLMAPLISNFFGTAIAPLLLRLLGCRIGRHCYIETALFSEFDLVEIGDHVALNAGTVMQNHLFEDRVMKSSRLRIGAGCTVGNMSVVLYDTHMEPGAVLGPLSLLMKGETMPETSRWHGIPTVEAR
jgi:non-ribosomal peptide synthetase-like protein